MWKEEKDPEDVELAPYLFLLDEELPFGILNVAPTEHIQIFREGNTHNIGKISYCAMTIDLICDYIEDMGMNYYKEFIDDMIEELQRRKKWLD